MILLKKTVYDKLVAKVNSINTSAFVLKNKCDIGKTELEKKILILVVSFKRPITMLK